MFDTLDHKHYIGYIFSLSVSKDPSVLQHKEMKNYYKIIHLRSGVFNFTLNKKDFVLTGDYALCINEKDSIRFNKAPAGSLRILLFKPCVINSKFDFNSVNDPGELLLESDYQDLYYLSAFYHDAAAGKKILPLRAYNSKNISDKMESIERMTNEQHDIFWPCRSRTCLFEILFSLIRQAESDDPGILPAFKGGSKLVSDIIYYLQSCYNQKISIGLLSNKFHTNRTTLAASFKNYTGQSVNKYLMQLRLMMASALLRDTELSIDEIRERTGFSDTGYFSKVFKRNLSCNPSEYRRIHCS